MHRNHKVICVTPAGRRRYMRVLVPMILSSNVVDEYHIWLNTVDEDDLAFLRQLARFDKVRLIEHPHGEVNGSNSIKDFFPGSMEEDAVYIRFDDDIVWFESDTIEKIVDFRIDHPEYFLITPCIINNAICTNMLINLERIDLGRYVRAHVFDKFGWKYGSFAEELHEKFLQTAADNESLNNLRFGYVPIASNRFSINCISWLGSKFSEFEGKVHEDEEEFLSCIKPMQLSMANCVIGNTFVVHFSFYTQREHLDATNILQRYIDLVEASGWIDQVIYREIAFIYDVVNKHASARFRKPDAKQSPEKPTTPAPQLKFPRPRLSVDWLEPKDWVSRVKPYVKSRLNKYQP